MRHDAAHEWRMRARGLNSLIRQQIADADFGEDVTGMGMVVFDLAP